MKNVLSIVIVLAAMCSTAFAQLPVPCTGSTVMVPVSIPASPPFCNDDPAFDRDQALGDWMGWVETSGHQFGLQCEGCDLPSEDGCELSVDWSKVPDWRFPFAASSSSGGQTCWTFNATVNPILLPVTCTVCTDNGDLWTNDPVLYDPDTYTVYDCPTSDEEVSLTVKPFVFLGVGWGAGVDYLHEAYRHRVRLNSKAFGFDCDECPPGQHGCRLSINWDGFTMPPGAIVGQDTWVAGASGTVKISCSDCYGEIEDDDGEWFKNEQEALAVEARTGLRMYPNPARDHSMLKVSLASGVEELRLDVMNLQGQVVKSIVRKGAAAATYVFYLDTSELPAGVYHAALVIDGASRETQRLVVTR